MKRVHVTPLMTAMHDGHPDGERLKAIEEMLFNPAYQEKAITVFTAFRWYWKYTHARKANDSN